jgi:hypothetical protein
MHRRFTICCWIVDYNLREMTFRAVQPGPKPDLKEILMANATTWMTDNFSQLSPKTLQEIVFFGTHDTGMSECHGTAANVSSLTSSTKTQTLNVHDQVVLAGVRYLDVRPSYYESNALSDNTPSGNYLAHWSAITSLTWGGLMGQPLADVCTNLTDAMAPAW